MALGPETLFWTGFAAPSAGGVEGIGLVDSSVAVALCTEVAPKSVNPADFKKQRLVVVIVYLI